MSTSNAEGRRLSNALSQAPDQVLLRVLGLLETQPSPAEAQALLDSARPRLSQLRPRRPLRLPRLLFWPLDGVIRPAAEWQRDRKGLPRSVLSALATQLQAAEPASWEEIARAAAGRFLDDAQATGPLGESLWALGARALPDQAPPGWEAQTGLREAEHAPLAALCRGVWNHAAALWGVLAPGANEAHLRAALAGAATEAPAVFEACLACLLANSERPSVVLAIAAGLGPACARIADAELDGMLETPMPKLDAQHPKAAAERAGRFAEMLLDLSESPAGQRSDRARRIAALRHKAAEACCETYDAGLDAALLGPAEALLRDGGAAAVTEAVDRLEAAARDLQRLARVGRKLGAGAAFTAADERLMERLASWTGEGGEGALSRVDLARLAEILCGPQMARRLID
jgi:hypothetical protein